MDKRAVLVYQALPLEIINVPQIVKQDSTMT